MKSVASYGFDDDPLVVTAKVLLCAAVKHRGGLTQLQSVLAIANDVDSDLGNVLAHREMPFFAGSCSVWTLSAIPDELLAEGSFCLGILCNNNKVPTTTNKQEEKFRELMARTRTLIACTKLRIVYWRRG
eukprot:4035295-Amphidinium_carterae.1